MAELSTFGFHYGQSFVHRLDVRFKLICLVLLTSAVMIAMPMAMMPMSLGGILLWISLRLPLRILGREMLAFLSFLLLVFSIRALSTPGDIWLSWGPLTIAHEGLQAGGQVVWRLLMILMLGLVFITTTRPSELKAALYWLLRPIPFVPAHKAATMVGLMVRFIPVLHQQMRETRSALDARAGLRRRLSWRRLRYFMLPTLRRIVLAADQLSLSMMARGYSINRTEPAFCARPADGLAVLVAGVVLTATLMV
jgi:energy-coupling factor transporter transmembrane protein EcfT